MLHPFLTHYQTFQPDGTCTSTGTTGAWNAANGSSSGWQQFQIDLGAYANKQVEVSITVLSDWGLQQFPGVFIDDIEVSTGEGSHARSRTTPTRPTAGRSRAPHRTSRGSRARTSTTGAPAGASASRRGR